ncbi:hypothetical protein [Tumebacillus sp. BK434]|uniref:hypothetical protein n=1 Tax=Tumebacillus sp. BK434 TaxID=2512169 RepID=UPI001043D7E8|nr:hypothetical protein [Tumebacillus sp. BK434]
MASNPAPKTEETTSIQGQAGDHFEIRGVQEEANMVEGLSEIGGIALGAAAYLVPGLGPVLSGGPVAGLAVGDTVGHYMSAQLAEERNDEQHRQERRPERPEQATASEEPPQGSFFLAVDTYTPAEADFASNIMEQHGGKVTRMPLSDEQESPQEEETVRYIPPDADIRYVAEQEQVRLNTQEIPSSLSILPYAPNVWSVPQHDLLDLQGVLVEPDTQYAAQTDAGIPDADYQDTQFPHYPAFPEAQSERRIPAQDGYELDPVAPLSPQNWIDPNIGLGNYDLYDPAARTQDNSEPPETGR